MKTAIIACEMTKAELTRVISQEHISYPVFWVEPALHNDPKRLHNHLQNMMDDHAAEFDRYLLAMGQCGNATENLKAGDYTIIIPRVDDCISLLLGSVQKRMEISREKATYFLTQSWLGIDTGNLLSGYAYTIQKYGPRRGKIIYRELLKHYKRLGLLDTGCHDLEARKAQVAEFAVAFDLHVESLPATDDYLRQLLKGPWTEDRFSITSPGATVHISFFDRVLILLWYTSQILRRL